MKGRYWRCDVQEWAEFELGEWAELTSWGYPGHFLILGHECSIWLEKRPSYCDRGRYIAKLDASGILARGMDYADGWRPGRYYFNLDRAKAEVEAWLHARDQI